MRMSFLVVAITCLALFRPTIVAADDSPVSSTGDFTTALPGHAPSSNPAELARRFGMKPQECTSVYDPAGEQLLVHFPANPGAQPPGLLVFFNKLHAEPPSAALKDSLDELHLAFVSPVEPMIGATDRAALALDIADAFQKQHTIDKRRIYLMEVEDTNFVAFTVADAYTGYVSLVEMILYEKVLIRRKDGAGFFEPHDTHVPAASMLALAKRRPFVFLVDPEVAADETFGENRRFLPAQMTHDGYAHITSIKVETGENRYPKFSGTWMKRAVAFLDAAQAPATAAGPGNSTSQPAASSANDEEAARILKLGKLYMDAGRKDAARTKLNEVIHKYPATASAAAAKKLLTQLDAN
jgi:hypothetical protein